VFLKEIGGDGAFAEGFAIHYLGMEGGGIFDVFNFNFS
jgi:hypothetical protein